MLLEYTFENYKSFSDDACFKMTPTPKLRQLSYSVLQEKVKNKDYKALCSSVIYGPNAAGKTSVIGALEVLKGIILEGNIEDKERDTTNIAVNKLELVPNVNKLIRDGASPVTLGVSAIDDGMLFKYELTFSVEGFLKKDITRKILSERLEVDEKLVFLREKNKVNFVQDISKAYLNTEKDIGIFKDVAWKVEDKELFLTGNFKAFYSNEIVKKIVEWFTNKLTIIYDAEQAAFIPELKKGKKLMFVDNLSELAKEFGSMANDVVYVTPKEGARPELCSVLNMKNGNKRVISSRVYESLGTRRIVELFPALSNALIVGGTILVDELDACIHPMAIASIVNAFHNDDINKKHAQLIFNTHNPIYLNSRIFRSDEIKFVDREGKTHFSTVYALSDFGTAGTTRAKNTNNYMKNYFVNKYGAIREVDFSKIFSKLVEEKEVRDE